MVYLAVLHEEKICTNEQASSMVQPPTKRRSKEKICADEHVGSTVQLLMPVLHPLPMAKGWTPNEWDVLCGKGNQYYTHIGNWRFRALVEQAFPQFQNAKSGHEKALIVDFILETVRKASKDGGFMKWNESNQCWFILEDSIAHQMIVQQFQEVELQLATMQQRAENFKTRRPPSMLTSLVSTAEASEHSNDSSNSLDFFLQYQSDLVGGPLDELMLEPES